MSIGLPRRSLLTAGLAVSLAGALAGCSAEAGTAAGSRSVSAVSVQGLRRRTARNSAALLSHYEVTGTAHPTLVAPLAPFRETAAAHLRALSDGTPSGPAGRTPEVPAEPAAAVAALVEAERRTSDERLAALAEAPPELARLLASLAAAGAAQAQLLSEVRV